MKRLCENISDIHIKGDISQLTDVVSVMDISLQNIAAYTDQLTDFLAKYSSSNKGTQYEKVVNTTFTLRDALFEAAEQLNDMQNQIVEYQNKIYRYEDMCKSAARANQYLINKRQVNVDMSSVKFNRAEMIEVQAALKNYSQSVYHHILTINKKKNAIAGVWMDTQYNTFSAFIDDVTQEIKEAIKLYEEYYIYLEEKIKEL